MPVVSVIIPAYNAEAFIGETLTSVIAQTLHDIEVIVVDDGSRDGTAKVVQSFPSVRYIHKANGGVSAARNHGVAHAQGEFIAFLDSDDIWHPDKLRQQVQAMREHPDSDLCRTRLSIKPADLPGIVSGQARSDAPHTLVPELGPSFIDPYFTTSAVMVRKSAFERVQGFDTSLRIAEDVDFYLRLLAGAPKIVLMTELLVYKRPVEGSLGDDSRAGYVQLLKVYDRFLAQHPDARLTLGEDVINRAYYHLHTALTLSHLWAGENRQARACAWHAMPHGPRWFVWKLILRSLLPRSLKQSISGLTR
ncbi:MAG: glycosyltransferase family 2 protein [Burkholderiales bacterium]|nr:glycosyltransferase family 2 protein [Burkholderiales bacterium]MBH2016233.1 glycosyltransferase family 2 protein [Burkholderiales bacterium]